MSAQCEETENRQLEDEKPPGEQNCQQPVSTARLVNEATLDTPAPVKPFMICIKATHSTNHRIIINNQSVLSWQSRFQRNTETLHPVWELVPFLSPSIPEIYGTHKKATPTFIASGHSSGSLNSHHQNTLSSIFLK